MAFCPICGAEHASCGEPFTGTPVDLVRKETVMAGNLVRVDRGDGYLFKLAPGKELTDFMAANPGAKRVESPPPPSDDIAMPEGPSLSVVGSAPNFSRMTRPQLEAHAAGQGLDVSSAKNKDEIVAILQAAEDERQANAELATEGAEGANS